MRLYGVLVRSTYAVFIFFLSDLAAGFECFIFNKGKRRLASQRGVQLCNETLCGERLCHKGSFFSEFIHCFMYMLHQSFPYGFPSLYFERCIEEPQVVLLQPKTWQMLMQLKPFGAKPLAASLWQRHWYLWSSAYLCQQSIWHRSLCPCWKTHLRRQFLHGFFRTDPVPLQLAGLRVSSPAPVPLAGMCLGWLRLSLFDCGLVQSPSGYTRNKQNLPCWWCRGVQGTEAGIQPRPWHRSPYSVILSFPNDPFQLAYSWGQKLAFTLVCLWQLHFSSVSSISNKEWIVFLV